MLCEKALWKALGRFITSTILLQVVTEIYLDIVLHEINTQAMMFWVIIVHPFSLTIKYFIKPEEGLEEHGRHADCQVYLINFKADLDHRK